MTQYIRDTAVQNVEHSLETRLEKSAYCLVCLAIESELSPNGYVFVGTTPTIYANFWLADGLNK